MIVILCKDSHVLLHVFSLVDWPKPVKSGSGGCLEWCGDLVNSKYEKSPILTTVTAFSRYNHTAGRLALRCGYTA